MHTAVSLTTLSANGINCKISPKASNKKQKENNDRNLTGKNLEIKTSLQIHESPVL